MEWRLKGALIGPKEILIDSNVFKTITPRRRELLGTYHDIIDYAGLPSYKRAEKINLSAMERFVDFYEGFLENPCVHITCKVKDELLTWCSNATKKIDRTIMGKGQINKFLAPVKKLKEILEKNYNRFSERGTEDDPVNERVSQCIASLSLEELSYTDKGLISTAFSLGVSDGGRIRILSCDRDIKQCLQSLSQRLYDKPEFLNLEDMQTDKSFSVEFLHPYANRENYLQAFFNPQLSVSKNQSPNPSLPTAHQ